VAETVSIGLSPRFLWICAQQGARTVQNLAFGGLWICCGYAADNAARDGHAFMVSNGSFLPVAGRKYQMACHGKFRFEDGIGVVDPA
jgi:hypothetical protein